MISEKLIDIYINKYIKGKIDFKGIELIPEKVYSDSTGEKKIEDLKLYWSVNNPKDISFTETALLGVIEDSLGEYIEVIGKDYFSMFPQRRMFQSKYCNLSSDIPDIYISKKMKIEISKNLREEVETTWRKYTVKSKGMDWWSLDAHREEITFECDVKIIEIRETISGKQLSEDEIDKFFKYIYKEGYDIEMNERLVYPTTDPIYLTKTIYDDNESYLRTEVNLYNKNGDRIETWS